jgi:hypothetical protein
MCEALAFFNVVDTAKKNAAARLKPTTAQSITSPQ